MPFTRTGFLPKALEGKIHLSGFLHFEESWSVTNRERGKLIDKNISGKIGPEERARLEALQAYAGYHIPKASPRPSHLLDELEKRFLGAPEKGGR